MRGTPAMTSLIEGRTIPHGVRILVAVSTQLGRKRPLIRAAKSNDFVSSTEPYAQPTLKPQSNTTAKVDLPLHS